MRQSSLVLVVKSQHTLTSTVISSFLFFKLGIYCSLKWLKCHLIFSLFTVVPPFLAFCFLISSALRSPFVNVLPFVTVTPPHAKVGAFYLPPEVFIHELRRVWLEKEMVSIMRQSMNQRDFSEWVKQSIFLPVCVTILLETLTYQVKLYLGRFSDSLIMVSAGSHSEARKLKVFAALISVATVWRAKYRSIISL